MYVCFVEKAERERLMGQSEDLMEQRWAIVKWAIRRRGFGARGGAEAPYLLSNRGQRGRGQESSHPRV